MREAVTETGGLCWKDYAGALEILSPIMERCAYSWLDASSAEMGVYTAVTSSRCGLLLARLHFCATHILRVIFGIAAFSLHSLSQVPVDGGEEGGSRYQRTVWSLQHSEPGKQADFATTALSELIEVYMAEADLARNQAEQEEGNAKLLGWSRAVDRYVSQLMQVLEDIGLGFPVELRLSREESVTVTVAGRAVILSHPRADQQATLEQRVLLDFCGRNDCKLLTASGSVPEPIPLSASQVKPNWAFTEDGPICSHGGIQLRFGGVQNLARSRSTCEQFMQEAMTLVNEVAWQRRHGVAVDWNKLSIRATPQRPEHLVQLNEAGDSILVTVPLIYSSGDLLGDIKPWLQGQFSDHKPTLLLNAARYGWEHTGE